MAKATEMKQYFITILVLVLFSFSGNTQSMRSAKTLTSTELLKDFEVLKVVLQNYNPGLYRFHDSLAIQKHFNTL